MTEAGTAGETDFARRMLHMMNEAALSLMVSVGHRTGLFDVMAAMPAATSAEIASNAALDERYVREWLAVMTTGAEADRKDLTNVSFFKRDAAKLGEAARFDFITTFDSVHDQARPDLTLAGIAQALRPDGVYLCVDTSASSKLADNVNHPLGPFLYTVSCMHCMTVSLADGGMGLGAMWGEQTARKMLSDAGFGSIEAVHVEGDIVNAYIIASQA